MQPHTAQPLTLGLKRGIHRPAAKVARLTVQLVFVLAIMAQVSRPQFWAGVLGNFNATATETAPVPGTALLEPQPSPPQLPAGMFQAPAPPDQKKEAPADLDLPLNNAAQGPIRTPPEDLPFLMETLVDLDRDLPPALYYHFLDKARHAPPERFLADARHDVTFTHLYKDPRNDPKKYRGQPLAITGIVRRALEFDIPPNAYGLTKRYELWVFTEDSGKFPWVVELTSLPPGFPLGTEIQEKIDTGGYFLKLWAYRAQDGFRSAPVLLGQGLNWKRADLVRARFEKQFSWAMFSFVGLFVAVLAAAIYRWRLEEKRLSQNPALLDLTSHREAAPDHFDFQAGVFPQREFDYIVHEGGPGIDEPPGAIKLD